MDREHMRRHMSDVERLVAVAAANGTIINRTQAYMAWSQRSDSYAAGWLIMPESDEDLWFEAQYEVSRITINRMLPDDAKDHVDALEHIQRALHTVNRYLDLIEVYELWTKVCADPETRIHDGFGSDWDIMHLSYADIAELAANHID